MIQQKNYHISRDSAPHLYDLEEQTVALLRKVARERMKLMPEGTGLWGSDGGIAQALYDLLDNFEKEASSSAAVAYLEKAPAKVKGKCPNCKRDLVPCECGQCDGQSGRCRPEGTNKEGY